MFVVSEPLFCEFENVLLGFAREYEYVASHGFGVFRVWYFYDFPPVDFVFCDEPRVRALESECVVEHSVYERRFSGGPRDAYSCHIYRYIV